MLNLNKDFSSPTFPKNWFLRGEGGYAYVHMNMSVCGVGVWLWVQGKYFLTSSYIYFSPVHHSAHVVWNTELRSSFLCPSFKSLVSAASAFCRQEVLAGVSISEAKGSMLLSTCSVFSESTKYMFVLACKYKGEKTTCFAFRKILLIWLFSERKQGELFFSWDCLIYLVPRMKVGVERVYSWGKRK